MGRGPDGSYQLNPTPKLLQWKVVPYTVPSRSPEFVVIGGKTARARR